MKKAFSKNSIRLSGALMALLIALSVFCTAISAGAESALMLNDSETLTQDVDVTSNLTSPKSRSIIAQGASVDIESTGALSITGGNIYFNASLVSSSIKNSCGCYFVVGKDSYSSVYTMSSISNTDLYYLSGVSWSGATYTSVMFTTTKWGDGAWGSSNLSNSSWYTKADTSYSINNSSGTYTITPSSSSTGQSATYGYQSSYSGLNYTINGYTRVGTTTSSGGKVSMSGYYISGNGSSSSRSVTASASASSSFALTSTVTLTATANSGYTFLGWSTSSSGTTYVSTSTTYSPTVSATKTYYAVFQQNSCSGPTLTSTASKTLVVGDTYTNTATCTLGTTVSYTSSNTGVATVNSAGKVIAVSKGTTTITATCSHSSKTYTVTVVDKIRIYVGVTTDWTTNWTDSIRVYNGSSGTDYVTCTRISTLENVNATTLRMFYADVPENWNIYISDSAGTRVDNNYGTPVYAKCYYVTGSNYNNTYSTCNPTKISSLTIPSDVSVGDSKSVTSSVSKSNTSTGNLTAGGTTYTITYKFTNTSTNATTTNTTGSLSSLAAGTYKVTAVLSDGYTSIEYDNGDTVTVNTLKDVEVVVPSISNGTFKFTYTNSSGTSTTATTAGTYTVKNGTDVTYEVTPSTGYYVSALSGITDSYTAVSGTVSKTKSTVKQGFTISCTITANPVVSVKIVDSSGNDITSGATVTNTSGTTSGNTVSQSVTYNSTSGSATFTVGTIDGTKYAFSGYCSAANTTSKLTTGSKTDYNVSAYANNSITIDTVKKDVTIYAVFIPVHKITISYTNLSSLKVDNTTTASGAVLYKASGSSVTMVATAASDYKLKASCWSATNATLSLTNSNTTASFTMGSSDVTITITPVLKSYKGTGSWGSKLLTIDTSTVNGGGEWFAAQFATSSSGTSTLWVRFTKVSDDSYICVIPDGYTYVKFYRMAKNATAFTDTVSNSDDATVAWNKTDDFLSVASTNKYKIDFIKGEETKITATAQ
jgi:hypothetical protein